VIEDPQVEESAVPSPGPVGHPLDLEGLSVHSNLSREQYVAAVRRIREHIAACTTPSGG
jgi:hypothetical protein